MKNFPTSFAKPGATVALATALFATFALSVAAPKPPVSEKIIGGTDASAGAYPWMTALVYKDFGSRFDNQFCGGVLIAPDWVLTAAHCVEGETTQSFEVWVGIHDLDSPGNAARRDVVQIIRHPGYFADSIDNLFNDVALLRLSTPVTGIAPIALASETSHNDVGSTARILGWGALDDSHSPFFPTILQQADLEIVSLASQQTHYDGILDSSHLAAAALPNYNRDTCSGDSGGPMFRTINNEPVLVGITSFGVGCAEPDIAGIYANILNLRPWIVVATDSDPNAPLAKKLRKQIKKLKKRAKSAQKRGLIAKSNRLKKKARKLQRRLRVL